MLFIKIYTPIEYVWERGGEGRAVVEVMGVRVFFIVQCKTVVGWEVV